MSRRRLGVVVNPSARAGRGESRGPAALAALRARGFEVRDYSATSLDEAIAAARQGVVDGMDALVVVGGDGMTHLGTNIVAGTTMPLGIIAVGTGNDVAHSLGLPVRAVAKSVDAIEQGLAIGPWPIDAVQVSSPDRSMTEWYAGLLSAGFDAAVNERTNLLTWPKGENRYIRGIFVELREFSPYGYRITIDGRVWESQGTIVTVANTTHFGGGIPISPESVPDDGLLDVIMAGPVTRGQLMRLLPRVMRGKHLDHPVVTVMQGREVLLEPTDAGRTPPAAYADGERLGPLPLRCELKPGALRILAPRPPRR